VKETESCVSVTVDVRLMQIDFKTIFCSATFNQNGMP
jgi:hypothetical protein